jgi:hypothetical protein
MPDKPEELVSVPPDLTLVNDADLQALYDQVTAEFTRINDDDQVTADVIEYGIRLADAVDAIRGEFAARQARAERAAKAEKAKLLKDQQNLLLRVNGEGAGDSAATIAGDSPAPAVDAEAIAAAAAKGATAALMSVLGDRVGGKDLAAVTQRATASLADARRFVPAVNAPKPKLAVTASVDIPGVGKGEGVSDISMLADMMTRKARSMPVTHQQPNQQLVASIRNEFDHVVDDRTKPSQVEELFKHLTDDNKKEALLAAGGWCAPSEIRYDFFNIACADGLIDLPTFGVSRGGIQFPTSPSLADVFGTNPNQAFGGFSVAFSVNSIPWLWTEASDIAAVTGSPVKRCIRVPCPSFSERRLECYGICVTAGNLTDDAYPESTSNFIRLMMRAHEHAMNQQIIATMVGLSSAAISTGEFADGANTGTFQQVYGAASLAATDYRARYGMCQDDIIEIVMPYWVKPIIRADIANRGGFAPEIVSDAQIQAWFSNLNVRVQFVNDWQVRAASQFGNATAMTAWPTTFDMLVYAAGTFILGNGLSLDLGVVRDSALNATNDYTAAWSEECHLVARVGHESRRYTVTVQVNGKVGPLSTPPSL